MFVPHSPGPRKAQKAIFRHRRSFAQNAAGPLRAGVKPRRMTCVRIPNARAFRRANPAISNLEIQTRSKIHLQPAPASVSSCGHDGGPYKLPKALHDRLERELAASRNAEASFFMAVFLGRFWTAPNRLRMLFPIDRRALTDSQTLRLSEGELGCAIRTLERVGVWSGAIAKKGS